MVDHNRISLPALHACVRQCVGERQSVSRLIGAFDAERVTPTKGDIYSTGTGTILRRRLPGTCTPSGAKSFMEYLELQLHNLLLCRFCRTLGAAFGAERHASVDTKATF